MKISRALSFFSERNEKVTIKSFFRIRRAGKAIYFQVDGILIRKKRDKELDVTKSRQSPGCAAGAHTVMIQAKAAVAVFMAIFRLQPLFS